MTIVEDKSGHQEHSEVVGETVSVLDTSELRWFAAGDVPPEVQAWFTVDGRTGTSSERVDTYWIDGRADAGVKRRFREVLELKVRQSVEDELVLTDGLSAPVEVWRKWSPADGLAQSGDHAPWVDVYKVVTKRRFSVNGDELMFPAGGEAPSGAGCDVEVTSISVGDTCAWTFAFAAFGPTARRREALLGAWRALHSFTPPPADFDQLFGEPSGYPEWLARVMLWAPDLVDLIEPQTADA